MSIPTNREQTKSKMTEYLANERTFLAWIRTSIATISLGFVTARFSLWLREIALSTGGNANVARTGLSLPIGLGMVAFGALMALTSAYRYREINQAIMNDLPQPRSTIIFATTIAVIFLGVVLILYLIFASKQF